MNYRKLSEIKSMAKGRLVGKYNMVAGAFVMIQLISFGLSQLVSKVADLESGAGALLNLAMIIIVDFIIFLFVAGELVIYMKLACGSETGISDVFSIFKKYPDRVIGVALNIFLRSLPWAIVITVALIIISVLSEVSIFWTIPIILLIVGMSGLYYTALICSQSLYILLDFPEYSVGKVVAYSIKIMNGHKMRYFKLILSFIPYYLLGICSLGVGLLWVHPYAKMAMTEFYFDIINPQAELVSEY